MTNSEFPIARTTGLVVQDVPNEVLVYDTETNEAHCLNNTAAMVWRSCDGKTSVSEIAQIVGGQSGEQVSDDLVWLAIDQLNEHRLLEKEIASKFAGESRRSVLKKIGFASMVALPVIASLVAPQSVLAATSCICQNGFGDCAVQPTCPQNTCTAAVCV